MAYFIIELKGLVYCVSHSGKILDCRAPSDQVVDPILDPGNVHLKLVLKV